MAPKREKPFAKLARNIVERGGRVCPDVSEEEVRMLLEYYSGKDQMGSGSNRALCVVPNLTHGRLSNGKLRRGIPLYVHDGETRPRSIDELRRDYILSTAGFVQGMGYTSRMLSLTKGATTFEDAAASTSRRTVKDPSVPLRFWVRKKGREREHTSKWSDTPVEIISFTTNRV